jgi:hypothetical protein
LAQGYVVLQKAAAMPGKINAVIVAGCLWKMWTQLIPGNSKISEWCKNTLTHVADTAIFDLLIQTKSKKRYQQARWNMCCSGVRSILHIRKSTQTNN